MCRRADRIFRSFCNTNIHDTWYCIDKYVWRDYDDIFIHVCMWVCPYTDKSGQLSINNSSGLLQPKDNMDNLLTKHLLYRSYITSDDIVHEYNWVLDHCFGVFEPNNHFNWQSRMMFSTLCCKFGLKSKQSNSFLLILCEI